MFLAWVANMTKIISIYEKWTDPKLNYLIELNYFIIFSEFRLRLV